MKAFQKILSQKGQAVAVFIILLVAALFFITLNISKIHPQYFVLFLLGVILFVVAFLNTNFALGFFIFSMLLSPQLKLGQLSERAVVLRVDDIFLFVIFIAWLAKLAVFKELNLLKRTVLNTPIFVYIFVCILSTAIILIQGQGQVSRSFFYIVKYFEYFMVYFLVVNNIENIQQVKTFVFLMIVTCLLVSLYGLYSHFALGLRATAPFEGPEGEANTLSGYLVLMMPVMLSLFLYSESQAARVGLIAVLAAASGALIFTLSRSGWISFAFMYFALIVISPRFKPFLIFSFVVMITLAPVLSPKVVKERVSSTFESGRTFNIAGKKITIDESGTARLDAWKVGFKKLAQKPVFGHGIPGASVVDNQYTRVMTEVGITGIAAFFFLLFRIFHVIKYSISVSREDNFIQGLCVGFLAGFFGLLAHCFSAATFILIRIMEPFWFLLAIIVLLPELIKRPEAPIGNIQGT